MTCREEHCTRDSIAPIPRLRLQLTLIAYDYMRNRQQRIDRLNVAIRAHKASIIKTNQMRRKVDAWLREVDLVEHQVLSVMEDWGVDPTSVTAQDWETMFKGQDRKLAVVLGDMELGPWPAGVPSLNLIALVMHEAVQREAHAKKRREKKKAREEKAHKKNEGREKKAREKIEAHEKKASKKKYRDKAREKNARTQKRLQAFAPPMNDCEELDVPINYNDPSAPDNEFSTVDFQIKQARKQDEYLRRSRSAPWTVSYVQWCEACKGTDALEEHPHVRKFHELARRREAAEKLEEDESEDD